MIGRTGFEIDAGADAALVQVGSAAGLFRRQAEHRHGRLAAVDDDAHVRNALESDWLERRMQLDALLNDGSVRPAAERIHAGKDIGDVLPQFIGTQPSPVVPAVIRTITADEHEHATAGRAAVRLDDEVAAAARATCRAGGVANAVRRPRTPPAWRRRSSHTSGAMRSLSSTTGYADARVVIEDARGVTAVHTKDAEAQ